MTPDAGEFDYEAALGACAHGDAEAFRRLYRRESARLFGVVLRIVREPMRAEDLVHDAFVAVWRRASQFDPARGSGRGWIYTIARHLALNAVRDGAHETGADEAALDALGAEASMQAWSETRDAFAWRAAAGQLEPCLERLDPVRRNCVLHAYVDGMSHTEIARQVAAPLGTVKAWIRRSLAALKECLQ